MYGMILYRIRTVSTIAKGIDFDFSIFFSGYRFRAVLVIGIVSNWISASYRNYYRNRVELRFVIVLNSSVSCRTRHRYHVEFVIGIVSNSLSVLYQTRYRHRIELDSRCCCCSATEGRLQYVTAVVYWFCWNSWVFFEWNKIEVRNQGGKSRTIASPTTKEWTNQINADNRWCRVASCDERCVCTSRATAILCLRVQSFL